MKTQGTHGEHETQDDSATPEHHTQPTRKILFSILHSHLPGIQASLSKGQFQSGTSPGEFLLTTMQTHYLHEGETNPGISLFDLPYYFWESSTYSKLQSVLLILL